MDISNLKDKLVSEIKQKYIDNEYYNEFKIAELDDKAITGLLTFAFEHNSSEKVYKLIVQVRKSSPNFDVTNFLRNLDRSLSNSYYKYIRDSAVLEHGDHTLVQDPFKQTQEKEEQSSTSFGTIMFHVVFWLMVLLLLIIVVYNRTSVMEFVIKTINRFLALKDTKVIV